MADYKNAILNTNAYSLVVNDKNKNHLSHTYLLLSEDMEFIKEFAKLQAQILLDLNDNDNGKLKIEKNIHPDVLIFGEDEKINTNMVSSIASEVFVRPYELDKKVYVLLNMQDMNEESQNKLLKTIEEPPHNVFFILGSTNERKLLKTVLSRAKKIELDLLENSVIKEMLINEGVNEEDSSVFSACSVGVFSRAYKMATDKDFLAIYQNIFKCLSKMNSSRDVLYFSNMFSEKNINKEELADLFMLITRDVCMAKINKFDLVNNSHKKEELKLISEGFSLEALYKIIEFCFELKEDLIYNTNISAVIDEFLLKIVEVKVKWQQSEGYRSPAHHTKKKHRPEAKAPQLLQSLQL